MPPPQKAMVGSTILGNFCLVSHVPFLGKVVEKLVVLLFQRILDGLSICFSHRPSYGTETALVTIYGWSLTGEEDSVHLDLSVAFNTINYGIIWGQLRELGWVVQFFVGSPHSSKANSNQC